MKVGDKAYIVDRLRHRLVAVRVVNVPLDPNWLLVSEDPPGNWLRSQNILRSQVYAKEVFGRAALCEHAKKEIAKARRLVAKLSKTDWLTLPVVDKTGPKPKAKRGAK